MLHTTTTRSVCDGRHMGAFQNRVTFFSFEKETFFQTILFFFFWQWFSSWKTSWAHFHGMDHGITPEPEPGRGSKEGSNSTAITKHQDVLLLEPKSFGFSTTIFSIWFLAGTRKKKKFVFIRSPSGKAPHPVPALPAGQASRNMALSLWIFISLGYWGRHLLRLLAETESVRSSEEKQQQSGIFSHGGGRISVLSRCSGGGRDISFPRRKISKSLGEAASFHSCLRHSWEISVAKVRKSPGRHSRAPKLVPHRVQVVTTWAWVPARRFSWYFEGKWKYMTTPALFQI